MLDELTESGLLIPYLSFGKTVKESIYRLTDEYAHFYIKFIEHCRFSGAGTWARFTAGASWKTWNGDAFESICIKHNTQLKIALGIASVHTETSIWRYKASNGEQGTQIDY